MNGTPCVVDSIGVGAFPEGLASSPNGQYLDLGNYKSHSISVLTVALEGPPASLRIGEH